MRSSPRCWNRISTSFGFSKKKRRNQRRWKNLRGRHRFELLEDRRVLAILTVNSLADSHINGDGLLTLREAIEVVQQGNTSGLDATTIANQISGPLGNNDIVRFAENLNGGMITLNLNFGQISFAKSLTIDASLLSNKITINGNDPTPGPTGHGIRIFNITDASSGNNLPQVELVGLIIKRGDVAATFNNQGGAIYSEGRLVIRDCTITENQAGTGGAIFVQVAGGGATPREVLRIENSVIDDNFAFTGGGIAIVSGSFGSPVHDKAVISHSTISDNNASSGGGVYADLYGAESELKGTGVNSLQK